ncbi:phosphate transport system substrate-binding protein [Entomoplasma freundtii]|uniref:Phosphate ABC transporter substrate-binding protein n=1 Tax=Entomoplasma freundtii TaxID=74700 RepID=A0A2K8NQY1_9MOLU|nr:phosphate ABC transporter substrate-binding protein [Entomoplasma freundtii]ATZ16250.1 phosphate ABC transporter substrate-binding protein [Entomoplasma freundtii]TDY56849.1 phosphate transport system substrate-binding protein [Entomoplasma freundtii]
MNKKFLITFSFLLSIILGLWIWTLAIPHDIIDIGGSASVDPLMQKITIRYQKEKKKKFIYSSTGSNTGITNLKKHVYEVAFISKDVPQEDFDQEVKQITLDDFLDGAGNLSETAFIEKMQSKGEGFFYLNFANDPLVFIYNIDRTGLTPEMFHNIQFNLTDDNKLVSNTLLKKIYEHNNPDDLISWYDLAKFFPMDDIDVGALEKVNKKLYVQPYSSTPGSGTWSSFEKLTNGVKPGGATNIYGNNGSIFYQISKSPGAFGYVSMGYAQNIYKYKNLQSVFIHKGGSIWDVKNDGALNPEGKPYPLTRPFNALLHNNPQNKKMTDILKFVYWFATSPAVKDIYKEEGLSQQIINEIKNLPQPNAEFYFIFHINEFYQLENWQRGKQWQ